MVWNTRCKCLWSNPKIKTMKKLAVLFVLLITLTSLVCDRFNSHVEKVYDGDTITLDINIGFGLKKTERIRMYGINAPEMRGSEKADGTKSRDALRKLILGKDVTLKTFGEQKRGKYGRLLGIVYINNINVNDWMVEKGYAKYKKY